MTPDLESNKNNRQAIRWPTGLGCLFARSEQRDRTSERDSDEIKNIIEQYWIKQLPSVGQANISRAGSSMSLLFPRSILSSNHAFAQMNSQGDGIHLKFNDHLGHFLSESGSVEWFEVTEVYHKSIANPKEIRAFRNHVNGYYSYTGFDPRKFLKSLNMSTPDQSLQKELAYLVLKAINSKLDPKKYQKTYEESGYGTLIVGIPLWFLMCNTYDKNAESTKDIFIRILDEGLLPFKERIKEKHCPFRRIVVIWTPSLHSVRQWQSQAKHDIYRKLMLIMVEGADKMKVKPGLPRDLRLSVEINCDYKQHKEIRLQNLLHSGL